LSKGLSKKGEGPAVEGKFFTFDGERFRVQSGIERNSIVKLKVGVVGCGYVGLTTGTCLAHLGHGVTCIDKDEGRVAALEEGRIPFYEPHL
jgi:threonine dehydrogenase-like Zn-dependent dehydrogenase